MTKILIGCFADNEAGEGNERVKSLPTCFNESRDPDIEAEEKTLGEELLLRFLIKIADYLAKE